MRTQGAPVLGVLKEKLAKDSGSVLEMASGSGMHINFFAPHFEHLHFHPSDKDIEVFDNIKKLSADAVSPGRDDSLQKAQGNLPIRSAR